MRTTLNVDDQLFDELMRVTQAKTKTEAVRVALNEYLRLKRKQQLLTLRGRLDIADNWRMLRELETEENEERP
jgi:hypothetical protein